MAPKGTVLDSTDPGTLRPDIASETSTGDYFEPLICPDFDYRTNLPPNLRPDDVFGIWSLFFIKELLETLVQYTNLRARARKPTPSRRLAVVPGLYIRPWVDVTLKELYTYFGILVCMALTLINKIEHY